MNLKVLKILIFFVFIIVVLTACTVKKSVKTTKTTLEFWTLQLSSQKEFINDVISKYEKLHPDIKIKWIDVPFSEGEKRALASVMSGNVPDIINMNPSFASTMAARGALLPLNDKIDKSIQEKYLDSAWLASSLEGKYFGIPWYITSSVTIYNKDLFTKAGLNPLKPPQSFLELINISKIIKNKTGKYAFMPNLTEDGFFIKVFNKYDINIVDEKLEKAVFNTPKAVEILEQWVNLYNEGLIPPESLNQTHRVSLERYESGETAILMVGANFLKTIMQEAPQIYKNSAVAEQIKGNNGKVDFSIMNLVVPLKSKNPDKAIDFCLYLTNSENQLNFSKITPTLPSAKDALNSKYFTNSNEKNLLDKARNISAVQLNMAIKPIPVFKNQKELVEIFDNEIQKALLKRKTPAEALDDAALEWNKILKD